MSRKAPFEERLARVTADQWAELFQFIPLLEEMEKGEAGESWIGGEYQQDALDLIGFFYRHDLMIVFDWMEWKEGARLLTSDPHPDFTALSLTDLFKCLTAIVRNDRFSEGFYFLMIWKGVVRKILEAVREKVALGA